MSETDAYGGPKDQTDGSGGWYAEETAPFGDRLAGAREAAGLTQRSLAEKLGIKLATLIRWEDDLAEPRANRLQMLAGMLGVSLSWLLTGVGDGPDGPDDEVPLSVDMLALLAEIRTMRTQMEANAVRLGQLEKRLRKSLKEGL